MGGRKTNIGSFVHIASFTSITGGGVFVMEDFTAIASGTKVFTGTDDYTGKCMTNPTVPHPYRMATRSFVCIKKHAIVGANTVILPGVTIGEGASVGANSLITKDCKPWTIYIGTPAKPLRERTQKHIMGLESQLRNELYDKNGKYIPKDKRT